MECLESKPAKVMQIRKKFIALGLGVMIVRSVDRDSQTNNFATDNQYTSDASMSIKRF